VQALRSADDCIHWAGADALGATDALCGHDLRVVQRPFCPTVGIKGFCGVPGQACERLDSCLATGRASIDVGFTARDRLGVGTASGVAAACALRLWKDRVDPVG